MKKYSTLYLAEAIAQLGQLYLAHGDIPLCIGQPDKRNGYEISEIATVQPQGTDEVFILVVTPTHRIFLNENQ